MNGDKSDLFYEGCYVRVTGKGAGKKPVKFHPVNADAFKLIPSMQWEYRFDNTDLFFRRGRMSPT